MSSILEGVVLLLRLPSAAANASHNLLHRFQLTAAVLPLQRCLPLEPGASPVILLALLIRLR